MKIKRLLENSLFAKSLRLAKSNPSKTGLMILFDILFLVSAFALFKLSAFFAQELYLPESGKALIVYILFSLIYYLALLLAYSFFKYCTLDFIKSLFGKTSFSFNRLGQFYALNIIIAGIFLAVTIVLNFVLAGMRQTYAPYVFIALAVPYLIFTYSITNMSHSFFCAGMSIKHSVIKGLKAAFAEIRIYRETILAMASLALALGLLFLAGGYLLNSLALTNYSLYTAIYPHFRQASVAAFDLVFYFSILINRISFYHLAKEMK